MARKNRTPEENARREKIRELLQMTNIGSMDDIQNLFKETIAEFMENGLEAELDEELGYSRYDYKNKETDNSRNGYSSKTLRTSFGDVDVSVPRDRKGEFEPQVLKKNQTSISQDIEEKILSMYAKGMSTGDIEAHIQDIYGISVSDSTVSRITDKILPIAKEWQQRPLESIYAVVFLDAIRYACHYKIRHPQNCDGQTGYSGEKLDGIIDKIVIQLFERMKTAPRSQLIQKQREKELQLANSSVANLEKLHASAERELESYKKEIIKTINGTGSFGADILSEMIEDTRSKLAALAQELEQAKEKAADLKSSAVAVQKEYDKIMSWADLYAGSSIERKKMILRQLIERVNIGKNFEIEVEFKISVTQFFDFLYPEGDKSVYYRAS